MHTANDDGHELLGVERRYADDGHAYTFQQFVEYFGEEEAHKQWDHPERLRHESRKSQVAHHAHETIPTRKQSEIQRLEDDMLENLVSVSAELYTESTRRSQLATGSINDTQATALSALSCAADCGSLDDALHQKARNASVSSESPDVDPGKDDTTDSGAKRVSIAEGREQDTIRRKTIPSQWAPKSSSHSLEANHDEEQHFLRRQNQTRLEEFPSEVDGLHPGIMDAAAEGDLEKLADGLDEVHTMHAKRFEVAPEIDGDLDDSTDKRSDADADVEKNDAGQESSVHAQTPNEAVQSPQEEKIQERKPEKVKEKLKMKKRGSLPVKKDDFRICAEVKIRRPEPLPVEDQQRIKERQRQLAEEKKSKEAALVIKCFGEDRYREDAGDIFKTFRKWWRGKTPEVRASAADHFGAPIRKEIFTLLMEIRVRALYRAQADEMLRDLIEIKEWIADKVVDVWAVNALINGEDETAPEDEEHANHGDPDLCPVKRVTSLRKHRSLMDMEGDPLHSVDEFLSPAGLEHPPTTNGSQDKEDKNKRGSAHGGLEKRLQNAEAIAEGRRKLEVWCKENGYADAYTRKKTYRGDSKFPLHTAVKQENVEIVKLLLQNGANKDCTNSKGETPLKMANMMTPGSIRDEMIRALR